MGDVDSLSEERLLEGGSDDLNQETMEVIVTSDTGRLGTKMPTHDIGPDTLVSLGRERGGNWKSKFDREWMNARFSSSVWSERKSRMLSSE